MYVNSCVIQIENKVYALFKKKVLFFLRMMHDNHIVINEIYFNDKKLMKNHTIEIVDYNDN